MTYDAQLRAARSTAKSAALRLGHRQARIRRASFHRGNAADPIPPLVALLAGRGHNDKALKLAILANWFAGSKGGGVGAGTFFPPESTDPFVGDFTSAVHYDPIAELLLLEPGLAETDRKIRRYFDQLARARLIQISPTYTRYRLLRDDASGVAYTDPGPAAKERSAKRAAAREGPRSDQDGVEPKPQDFYVALPEEFFRNGWLSALSGPALIALLLHLDLERRSGSKPGQASSKGEFANETYLADYVPISATSYERGVRLLRNWGVLTAQTEVIRRAPSRRSRYRYTLVQDAFSRDAPSERPERDPKLHKALKRPRRPTNQRAEPTTEQ